jgi:hypothetical protein
MPNVITILDFKVQWVCRFFTEWLLHILISFHFISYSVAEFLVHNNKVNLQNQYGIAKTMWSYKTYRVFSYRILIFFGKSIA